ncbi:class I SAM-dependent methyltransferase [Oceanicaulis sp. MMSF_3324]|uniref:class I SAM-dependent methyltransferase n=1 Tax=Oceanicaulis sp. MMSF_3324 TaxID=3046702 RepID=UPI00273DCD63|nr:class I SAM-dependent methyltransferase [Oceanicaulis sp. MMSF_3324]
MSAQYSHYDALENMKKAVADGHHRAVIGGMWDELGALQKQFLLSQGLKPEHRFIDMGCGSLRAGVPLTEYLDAQRYYGVDISPDLLVAGYEREIVPAGLEAKLPRSNLAANADFDATGFGVKFDYGIAQSVFTHMPITRLTDCLTALRPVFTEGGRFYVTYFERPDDADPAAPLPHEPGGVVTHPDRDPYDTTLAALSGATPSGWRLNVMGRWDHPRDQRMALFIRETGQD